MKGNYAGDETDTYYGEAMAIVRAGDGAAMTVTVDDGEKLTQAIIPVR